MIVRKDWTLIEQGYYSEKAEVVYVSHDPFIKGDDYLEIDKENKEMIMYHLKQNLRLIDEVLLEYGMTVKDLRRFNPHE